MLRVSIDDVAEGHDDFECACQALLLRLLGL